MRKGDQAAFDTIFRDYYGRLVGFAERMLRQRAIAEELGQDVLLELWKRRETLALEVSLRAYLFQAIRNRALNHLRREKVEKLGEPFAEMDTPTSRNPQAEVMEAEIDAAVRDAVSTLPERCRQVFELSRVRGLRYAEIAEAMDISVKTVEVQMGKALKVLREALAPWMNGEW